MAVESASVSVSDLELHSDSLDVQRAAAIYGEHGALVVRGLSKAFVEPLRRQMEQMLEQAVSLLPQAVSVERHAASWATPDGAQFNDDPNHPGRKVINSLNFNAMVSGTFLQALLNPHLLDVVEAIIGPDIELWKWGQCIYRQPDSGVPKSLHQDEYYFEHKHQSTVAVLSYAIDVDMQNSPLMVVPGSHKLGLIDHVNDEWAGFALEDNSWWDRAIPITGQAGDAIFFTGATIHGSPANRSDRPRPVFIQRYRRADDFCIIDVANIADRANAAANPIPNKTDDDWGLMVRGLRRYHPPQDNT